MASDIDVTITWMDSTQENYTAYDYTVRDGVLTLKQRMHSSQPDRSFPIANIRTWTVTQR